MNKHIHAKSWAAAAVVAGLITATATGGPAAAAGEEITGTGTVTLDFSAVPGSVVASIWTQNLSTVEAWGTAVITDRDSAVYAFGPHHYAAGEVWTDVETLPGYACSDLGSVTGVAFGFSTDQLAAPEWTSGPISYPDSRITVIGCDVATTPTEDPDPTDPVEPIDPEVPVDTDVPVDTVAPVAPAATTGTNTLPAAKTDGSLVSSASQSSPMFGFMVTLGALIAAGAGAAVNGAVRRR